MPWRRLGNAFMPGGRLKVLRGRQGDRGSHRGDDISASFWTAVAASCLRSCVRTATKAAIVIVELRVLGLGLLQREGWASW